MKHVTVEPIVTYAMILNVFNAMDTKKEIVKIVQPQFQMVSVNVVISGQEIVAMSYVNLQIARPVVLLVYGMT